MRMLTRIFLLIAFCLLMGGCSLFEMNAALVGGACATCAAAHQHPLFARQAAQPNATSTPTPIGQMPTKAFWPDNQLSNVTITNNATQAGEVPTTTSANSGAWQPLSTSASQQNWTPTTYASLPTCNSSTAPSEYWVTGAPGGVCRNNYPPALAYNQGGIADPVAFAAAAIAFAPSGGSSATIHGSTVNSGASATINVPTNSNGDVILWIVNNALSYVSTPSGFVEADEFNSGDMYLSLFLKLDTGSEPPNRTITGTIVNVAQIMYAISGAVQSTTPDAIAVTGNGGQVNPLVDPALSGLSSSQDLWIGAWATNANSTLTMTGSPTTDQYQQAFPPGGLQVFGLLTSHLALSTTSLAGQTVQSTNGPLTGLVTCKLACKEFLDGTYAYVEEGP